MLDFYGFFFSLFAHSPSPRNCFGAVTSCGRAAAWWKPARNRSCRPSTKYKSRRTTPWPPGSATLATEWPAKATAKTMSFSLTASRAAWPRARAVPDLRRPNATPSICRNPIRRWRPLDRRRRFSVIMLLLIIINIIIVKVPDIMYRDTCLRPYGGGKKILYFAIFFRHLLVPTA